MNIEDIKGRKGDKINGNVQEDKKEKQQGDKGGWEEGGQVKAEKGRD